MCSSFPYAFVAAFSLAACATAPSARRETSRDDIAHLVRAAAKKHDVPASLILGVIAVESSFNPKARSRVGAGGLMQLMPRTAASLARRLGYSEFDVHDPAFNIDAGTYYLAYLLRTFDRDEALSLAAYNAGPARVKRWQKRGKALPTYSRRYVSAVRKARARFSNRPETAPLRRSRKAHDRAGLRQLLRKQLYGERGDEPLAGDPSPPKK